MKPRILFLLAIISTMLLVAGCKNNKEVVNNIPIKNIVQENLNFEYAINYDIVETENLSIKALDGNLSEHEISEIRSLPTNKKMSYRIVVSPTIKENQVKPTINKIIYDLTFQDKDIDEIILFLYSDKDIVKTDYDVARAIWASGGELGNVTSKIAKDNNRDSYQIKIDIKKNLEEYFKQRNIKEDKFGLTEQERKLFYKEFVTTQSMARKEADRIYPTDIYKNIDKTNEFVDKYQTQLRAKYNLTKEQESKIISEALEKHWSY